MSSRLPVFELSESCGKDKLFQYFAYSNKMPKVNPEGNFHHLSLEFYPLLYATKIYRMPQLLKFSFSFLNLGRRNNLTALEQGREIYLEI